jgi:hypothetical protein
MSDKINNASQMLTKTFNTLKESIKEPQVVLILTIMLFSTIFFLICYVLYIKSLSSREIKSMNALYGDLNGSIQSISSSNPESKYLLRDYYIKTAYNCCSGGAYKNDFVNIDILKNMLKQGVRGLDFEVFSIDDQPVVATSTSDSYYIKETYNDIGFGEVMNVIRDYAFATATSPNPKDPIIIHLRIKSTNQEMYKNFAKILEGYDNILLGKDYSYENHGINLGTTPLQKLSGKVVIIVDRSNNSFLECQEFYEFVNMTSNSVFMRALHYYDIAYSPDINELIQFNKTGMTIGLPDKGSDPKNPSGVVLRETGTQMIAMRYQLFDANLQESDMIFDMNNSAFVLKPENLRAQVVTIATPPLPNPDVSYATRTVSSDFYHFEI